MPEQKPPKGKRTFLLGIFAAHDKKQHSEVVFFKTNPNTPIDSIPVVLFTLKKIEHILFQKYMEANPNKPIEEISDEYDEYDEYDDIDTDYPPPGPKIKTPTLQKKRPEDVMYQ